MNILLTSVGRRSYLVDYFLEAVLDTDQIHCCNSEYTTSVARGDGYFLSPLIYSPDYVDSIIRYCKERDITAVLSLFDIDLLVLSKNEQKFKNNGIELILAPYESVYLCNDKWKTFEFLKEVGLKTPRTYLSVGDALQAIESSELEYPLVIKPRWGMASMGLYFADNENELKVLFEKSKKDVFSSYLKYESELTKESSIIIQEKLIGAEYGVDVVNTLDSEYFETLAKQKVTMRAGE
ncbi:ATP-grasp domain-containing protein [Paraglaciecola sp. MB-3u-78]|uniref:ATP-grasp domain-containing protein n=1 Tax=Paraglaciecola sp. MB-3u-78 TaxID=2058332 RepID=UPI0012FEF871|nr:ATP-grasp domain-containing protein [Paraglaciecola sp. MB-3u-78]